MAFKKAHPPSAFNILSECFTASSKMNLPPYVIAIPKESCLIVLKPRHKTLGQ